MKIRSPASFSDIMEPESVPKKAEYVIGSVNYVLDHLEVGIAFPECHLHDIEGKTDDGNIQVSKVIFKDGSSFAIDKESFNALNSDGSAGYGFFCSRIIMPSDASFNDLLERFMYKCIGMNPEAYSKKIENGIRLIFSRMSEEYSDDPIANIRSIIGPDMMGSIDDYLALDKKSFKSSDKRYSAENVAFALLKVYGYDPLFKNASETGFAGSTDESEYGTMISQIERKIDGFNGKEKLDEGEMMEYNELVQLLHEFEKEYGSIIAASEIERKVADTLVWLGLLGKGEERRKEYGGIIKKYKEISHVQKVFVASSDLEGIEGGDALRRSSSDLLAIGEVIYDDICRKFGKSAQENIDMHFDKALEEYGFDKIDIIKLKVKLKKENIAAKRSVESEIYGGTLKSIVSRFYNRMSLMNDYLNWDSVMFFGDRSLELDRLAQIERTPMRDLEDKQLKGDDGEYEYLYSLNGKPVQFSEPGNFYSGKEKIVKTMFKMREGAYSGMKLEKMLDNFYADAGLDPGSDKVYAVRLLDREINAFASMMEGGFSLADTEDAELKATLNRVKSLSSKRITDTIEKRIMLSTLFQKNGRFAKESVNYFLMLAEDGCVDPFEEMGIKEFFAIIGKYPQLMDKELARFIESSFREHIRPEKIYSETVKKAAKIFSTIISEGIDDRADLIPKFLKFYLTEDISARDRAGNHIVQNKFVFSELTRWETALKNYNEAISKIQKLDDMLDAVTTDIEKTNEDLHRTEYLPLNMMKELVSLGILTEAELRENGVVNENGYKYVYRKRAEEFTELTPWMKKRIQDKKSEAAEAFNPFYDAVFDYRKTSMGGCIKSCSTILDYIRDIERVDILKEVPMTRWVRKETFAKMYSAKRRLDKLDPTIFRAYILPVIRKGFKELASESSDAEDKKDSDFRMMAGPKALAIIEEEIGSFSQKGLENSIDRLFGRIRNLEYFYGSIKKASALNSNDSWLLDTARYENDVYMRIADLGSRQGKKAEDAIRLIDSLGVSRGSRIYRNVERYLAEKEGRENRDDGVAGLISYLESECGYDRISVLLRGHASALIARHENSVTAYEGVKTMKRMNPMAPVSEVMRKLKESDVDMTTDISREIVMYAKKTPMGSVIVLADHLKEKGMDFECMDNDSENLKNDEFSAQSIRIELDILKRQLAGLEQMQSNLIYEKIVKRLEENEQTRILLQEPPQSDIEIEFDIKE